MDDTDEYWYYSSTTIGSTPLIALLGTRVISSPSTSKFT